MEKKKTQFIWLTIAGFLTTIGSGVAMSVVAAVTELQKTNLLMFMIIGVALCMGLGVLAAFIGRGARRLDVNTPVYQTIAQILPVMLSICTLFALPLFIGMSIIKTNLGFTVLLSVTVGIILTSGFAAMFKAIAFRGERK
ncbi:MAG: hypothetical protein SPD47_06530 [Oscillospiraceae bacterium]|nr:hypothetical protein [Oscillospiraceae bacterium]